MQCSVKGCPFRVHTSPALDGSMFVIKTLTDKHPSQVVKKNKMAFCSWIASRLAKDFKDYPDLDLKCISMI